MSRRDAFGLAKQAAWGTPQLTPSHYPPVTTLTSEPQREEITIEETIPSRAPTPLEYGSTFYNVAAHGALRCTSFPRILSGFVGATTPTQPDIPNSPTAYKHSFDAAALAGALVPHSLCAYHKDPNPAIVDFFTDCYGDELQVSCDPNGFVEYDAKYVGRLLDGAQGAPTVTADVSQRFPFHQVHIWMTIPPAGEAEVKCGAWSFTLGNGLDAADYTIMGSQAIQNIGIGNLSLAAQFAVRDATLFKDWKRRNEQAVPADIKVRIAMTSTVKTAGAGSTQFYSAEFTLADLQVTNAPANISAADTMKEIVIGMRGSLDGATSKILDGWVINETASY